MFGEISEEALHHVQPRSAGGSKVTVKALVTREPRFYFGMLVRGVVVADQMNRFSFGHASLDEIEKLDPFLMPVFLLAGSDEGAVQDV